jgi:UDP-N-acetylmuramoyl-L-alanyl-D-glutamate--2,6-diaminopimelate ligase
VKRLDEILDLGPSEAAVAERPIGGLTADSRKVRPGDAFFALAGAKQDGLAFVADALAKGAAIIVGERAPAGGAPFVKVADARAALAKAAARFYPRQPDCIVAVTGTSGKTSVAAFTRQIWMAARSRSRFARHARRRLARARRLRLADDARSGRAAPTLDKLAGDGVTHLALEASSHGLDQKRLDGVRLAAGAFTNLSRDHLDYHATKEAYLDAKLRLFRECSPPRAPR